MGISQGFFKQYPVFTVTETNQDKKRSTSPEFIIKFLGRSLVTWSYGPLILGSVNVPGTLLHYHRCYLILITIWKSDQYYEVT